MQVINANSTGLISVVGISAGMAHTLYLKNDGHLEHRMLTANWATVRQRVDSILSKLKMWMECIQRSGRHIRRISTLYTSKAMGRSGQRDRILMANWVTVRPRIDGILSRLKMWMGVY